MITTLQVVNNILHVITMPVCAVVIYRLIVDGRVVHDSLRKSLLASFSCILIASFFSIYINYLLLTGFHADDILLHANIRNLIKNIGIITLVWTFGSIMLGGGKE